MQLFRTSHLRAKPSGEVKIADPIYAGIRSHNFDRYYQHPEFNKLGWHPYANNEEYYNANSSWWDDAARSSSHFVNLVGTGFMGPLRSIGDLFDGDDYFSGKDMASAAEFADAMRIGNSTRGGVFEFSNNLGLQMGYMIGTIGEIAVEELALWGATAGLTAAAPATFGGTAPAAGAAATAATARTAVNIGRLGRVLSNTFAVTRLANASRNMYRSFRTVDGAKDFYNGFKTTGKFLADVIAPETAYAIRTLNSTANGAQNLTNLAKMSKTFGGFYRDLRSLNLALAESKMEGGMVYAQQLANGYAYKTQENNGQPLSTEQMNDVVDKASKAAYHTTLLNAPVIYFSNQLTLGTAFGAYNRSLARMLGDNIDGLAKRVIKTQGSKAAGKIATRPFADAGTGFTGYLNRMKAAGVQGSLKMAGQASLRYFSANLAEGLQEVTQEAISVGTKNYYQEMLKHPAAGGNDLLRGSISSAVASQFNSQGFETFMSGFLMGGIAQGPQKLFFQGVPALYQKTFQKEKYEEYRKNKEEFVTSLVKSMNDAYEVSAKNPMESIFDTNKINLVLQSQASADALQAAFDQSNFDFVDAKDFSKFQAIYTVLSNNKAGEFRLQFEDYLKMTDQELGEAFPESKQDVKSGKLRQRMQDMITTIDQLEDSYFKNKDKFQNPFDPSIYKFGSR